MTKIIQRHDTAANWSTINPVLALGEMGVETDTNKFKFGDGTTTYNELPYAAGEGGGSDAYTKEETDTLLSTKQDILSDGNGTKVVDNKVNINQGEASIQGLTLYQNNGTITKNNDLSITFNNGACGYIFLENKGVSNDYEIILHQSYLNTHGTARDSNINGVRCLPQAVVPTLGEGARGECWFDTFDSPFRVVAVPNDGSPQIRTVDNINYIKYVIKGTNLTISYSSTGEAYTELYTISISSTYVINVCIANSPWQNDIANKWTKTTLYSDSYVLDKTTNTYLMKKGIRDEGVAVATSTRYGLVLPDNSTIVSNNGIISSTGANTDLSNISETGEKHFLNKSQITNCLLEVPQRIKLELNDGTLTLKAGSQVIIPNGFEADGTTPKFDYVDIGSDVITSAPYTNGPIFINYRNGQIGQANSSAQCSGTSSTISSGYWYDTTNNFINRVDSGEVSSTGLSFPLAIINASNGSWASINQVFNGMGYIGSTVWLDKGVKGLIPGGRNEDGTLKTIEQANNKLFVRNYTTLSNGEQYLFGSTVKDIQLGQKQRIFISDVQPTIGKVYERWYNPSENKCYYHAGGGTTWLPGYFIIYGTSSVDNKTITSFNPKQPFRAVDYNDKQTVSSWAMPSSKYIDLTLGASGSKYIAPVNGYFAIKTKVVESTSSYLSWVEHSSGGRVSCGSQGWSTGGAFIPCAAGQYINFYYEGSVTVEQIGFIYAEGEV